MVSMLKGEVRIILKDESLVENEIIIKGMTKVIQIPPLIRHTLQR